MPLPPSEPQPLPVPHPVPAAPRSEELDEVISAPPAWIVQWGISLFFLLLVGLLVGSWAIHYPDLVPVSLQVTTVNAPKPVNAKGDGKLTRLLVKENRPVLAGQVLAYVESTADHAQVIALDAALDHLLASLRPTAAHAPASFPRLVAGRLGELQPAYQVFEQAYIQYQAFQRGGFFAHKRQILITEMANVGALTQNLRAQQGLYTQDVGVVQREIAVQKELLRQRVIAPADFRKEVSRLLPKQLALRQAELALLQNQASLTAKQRELLELDKLVAEQQGTFQQAANSLRSAIEGWKSRYLLVAPVAGRVSFSTILEENQPLSTNQEVFYIDPETTAYYGQAAISQANLGKVKVGQRVLVKLAGYPFQEFGMLAGRIAYISRIPAKDNSFLAKIVFPQGLVTTYGKTVAYRNGIQATGDIVTTDSRLLEKLFYSFRQAVSR